MPLTRARSSPTEVYCSMRRVRNVQVNDSIGVEVVASQCLARQDVTISDMAEELARQRRP